MIEHIEKDDSVPKKVNEIIGVLNPNDEATQINTTNIAGIFSTLSAIGTGIIDKDFDPNNGYVRFENGLQIAWKNANDTSAGEQWQGLYFSDVSMGTWRKPFTELFGAFPSANLVQYWTGKSGQTNSSAGTVRLFRPNAHGTDKVATIMAIGRWK